MRRLFTCVGAIILLYSCGPKPEQADYRVVPLPQEITPGTGTPFVLDNQVKILYPEGNQQMQKNAEFLAEYVKKSTGKVLETQAGTEGNKAIVLKLGLTSENPEAYQLTVTDQLVTITAPTEAGVFRGIQTLRKSLPVVQGAGVVLPPVAINDYPRFKYRAMMLDVSRHFFSLDSVKRYIDILALHNINNFHWHLTDDQGWRIEIKKFPKLTEIGSQRKETVIGRNSGKYDGIPYGGYFTQEEAKEVVAYAKERYINVIPEIDMPGHMLAALTAYPELGCTGGPYEVWPMWGVADDVLCAGNDKTLEFIDGVLEELIEIFPFEYIHVGGDECPKVRWEKCPKCQARIRKLGLKPENGHSSEERLQSFIISHAEKFLNQHGRKIIGWDEILEGGLAPNATVMSWRGMEGGIEAARLGHDVIMVPTTYLYFDYYQTKDTEDEPLAIGGYVPIENVYHFEPIPSVLNEEQKKHIIGLQANLWVEYIPTFKHVEYMVLPRMAALCEVQWTMPEKKNYEDFLTRLPHLFDVYNLEGYNFAKHLYHITAEFTPNEAEGKLDIKLSTIDHADIHYTLDGTEPTEASPGYDGILKIDGACTLKAVAVRPTGKGKVLSEQISFNKATLKPIMMNQPVNKQYEFKGAPTLVDGLKGSANYKTGRWIAFYKNDMEAVIDLQKPVEISSVILSSCVEKGDWVFDTRGISVAVSEDGKDFREVASEEYPAMKQTDRNGVYDHRLDFTPVTTRYVKVMALSEHRIPDWHGGKGNFGFLFVDEIAVN